LLLTLLAAELFMAATSTSLWEKVVGYRLGAKLAQVYGTYVWAYLLFLVALVALLATERWRRVAAGDWLPASIFRFSWRSAGCLEPTAPIK
jgi:hypothetical protein